MTSSAEETKEIPSSLLNKDVETNAKKLKYPKSVFFIVSNEFCERFCFYGMRTILALYLNQYLNYSEDDATIVYHAFVMFAYFTPLLGGALADSWLGKFKTILILSLVYALGSVTISLAAMPNVLPAEAFTYVGLILIGLGTGGIKPCVSSFGGDQFVVPEQERQLQQFFSVFYFSVNGGSLLSTFITPLLREEVQCFGQDNCYSLAFGVPAILMIVAIVIFIAGKPLYKVKPSTGNVVGQVVQCIGHAISQKFKNKGPKKAHWLDYSVEKYGEVLVEDVKSVLKALTLFIPLPMFWALFDQQGSRWTFQASRMDGDFGGFTIYPDQLQLFNPAMVLILIPFIEGVVYPLFKRCNIMQQPLHKIAMGGILAGIAFCVSALVELAIKPTEAVLPVFGETQLRIVNTFNCPMVVSLSGDLINEENLEIAELDMWTSMHQKAQANNLFTINVKPGTGCVGLTEINADSSFSEKTASTFMIYGTNSINVIENPILQNPEKSNSGNPKMRVLYNMKDATKVLTLQKKGENKQVTFDLNNADNPFSLEELEITNGAYVVKIGDIVVRSELYAEMGAVYNYVITETDVADEYVDQLNVVTNYNSVNILWQIPQYLIITFGEVMFSITGLEFAFTQAPLAMKSVVTSGWLMVVAFGNLIVIIVAEAKFFEDPMWEFLLFAGLMFLSMIVFLLMTIGYQYKKVASEDSGEVLDEKKGHDNEGYKDQ